MYEGNSLSLYQYVKSQPTIYIDPLGEDGFNPFSWCFPSWEEAIDEEIELVKQLNDLFGTNHSFLNQFTPEKRAAIEAALGTDVDWQGPFKMSNKCYEGRECCLKGSKGCLIVAGVADAAAGCCVGILFAAQAVAVSEAAALEREIAILVMLIKAAREAGNGQLAAQLAAQLARLEQGLPR